MVQYNYVYKEIVIKYSDISAIKYRSVSRGDDINRLYFNQGELKKLRIRTVASKDEFIEFVKWIKSKNEKIEVSVHPSDHILNHKLQEIYGFNYRKVRNPERE